MKTLKITGLTGILSILFYFSAVLIPSLPNSLVYFFAFGFPLLWIVSFTGMYHCLEDDSVAFINKLAYVFGVVGAAICLCLLVIQLANQEWHEQFMQGDVSERREALYKAVYFATDRVQASLDIAFDIFITISWMLFGIIIVKTNKLNKVLGSLVFVMALGLLSFNMYTFPNAPADSGLIDLGPLLGIVALGIYINLLIKGLQRNTST